MFEDFKKIGDAFKSFGKNNIDTDNNDTHNKSKIFISLGNYCLTSMIFKYNNLKFESYPFDWMVSKIDNIIHVINDDFKDFLNKNNYTKIKNGTRNNVYFNNTNSLFNFKFCN